MWVIADPAPDTLAMPRFDDGAIDMQELLRRLAEQVVNAVMDAEADQLCGGGANSRNGYRERALVAAGAEMYATGTSTRKVQRIAGKMGVSRLSKDKVSAIAASSTRTSTSSAAGRWTARPYPT